MKQKVRGIKQKERKECENQGQPRVRFGTEQSSKMAREYPNVGREASKNGESERPLEWPPKPYAAAIVKLAVLHVEETALRNVKHVAEQHVERVARNAPIVSRR